MTPTPEELLAALQKMKSLPAPRRPVTRMDLIRRPLEIKPPDRPSKKFYTWLNLLYAMGRKTTR